MAGSVKRTYLQARKEHVFVVPFCAGQDIGFYLTTDVSLSTNKALKQFSGHEDNAPRVCLIGSGEGFDCDRPVNTQHRTLPCSTDWQVLCLNEKRSKCFGLLWSCDRDKLDYGWPPHNGKHCGATWHTPDADVKEPFYYCKVPKTHPFSGSGVYTPMKTQLDYIPFLPIDRPRLYALDPLSSTDLINRSSLCISFYSEVFKWLTGEKTATVTDSFTGKMQFCLRMAKGLDNEKTQSNSEAKLWCTVHYMNCSRLKIHKW